MNKDHIGVTAPRGVEGLPVPCASTFTTIPVFCFTIGSK